MPIVTQINLQVSKVGDNTLLGTILRFCMDTEFPLTRVPDCEIHVQLDDWSESAHHQIMEEAKKYDFNIIISKR
jgi:hypothetical protein